MGNMDRVRREYGGARSECREGEKGGDTDETWMVRMSQGGDDGGIVDV